MGTREEPGLPELISEFMKTYKKSSSTSAGSAPSSASKSCTSVSRSKDTGSSKKKHSDDEEGGSKPKKKKEVSVGGLRLQRQWGGQDNWVQNLPQESNMDCTFSSRCEP